VHISTDQALEPALFLNLGFVIFITRPFQHLHEPGKDTEWQKATGARLEVANLVILREQRFKLVHFNGNLPPLLFDLKDDPDEMHNLADDPAHMATLLRLTQKLLSHRMEHADRTISDVKITKDGAVNFVW